jgi:hypothetical protein
MSLSLETISHDQLLICTGHADQLSGRYWNETFQSLASRQSSCASRVAFLLAACLAEDAEIAQRASR